MEDKSKFKRLLEKYHRNNLTEEEFLAFIKALNQEKFDEHSVIDEMAKEDWGESLELLQKIDIEQKRERSLKRQRKTRWWIASAAVLLILVGVFGILAPPRSSDSIIYETKYGEIKNIELPDGSSVLLNANSKITWEKDWKRTKNRMVHLSGEAFFDVVKREGMHFQVDVPKVKIDVLGTEFNVRYRGEETEVFLQEGSVNLQANDGVEQIKMKPGDLIRYDPASETLTTEKKNLERDNVAWVKGVLQFDNKPLSFILHEFEELYGKKFKIENKELADKRMDFSLPYADWELVKKALEYAVGAAFIENKDSVIVK